MRDRMTPEQMDAVQAFDNVHGVGLARLIEIVTNGLARLIIAWGDETGPSYKEMREQLDPWLRK